MKGVIQIRQEQMPSSKTYTARCIGSQMEHPCGGLARCSGGLAGGGGWHGEGVLEGGRGEGRGPANQNFLFQIRLFCNASGRPYLGNYCIGHTNFLKKIIFHNPQPQSSILVMNFTGEVTVGTGRGHHVCSARPHCTFLDAIFPQEKNC